MKKIKIFLLILIFSQISFGQTSSTTANIRRGIATVMFAGLGGAVVGLSTLSFYGEPQEHIGNIWLGLGIGAIAGTAYLIVDSQKEIAKAPVEKNIFAENSKYTPMAALRTKDVKDKFKLPVIQWEWAF